MHGGSIEPMDSMAWMTECMTENHVLDVYLVYSKVINTYNIVVALDV